MNKEQFEEEVSEYFPETPLSTEETSDSYETGVNLLTVTYEKDDQVWSIGNHGCFGSGSSLEDALDDFDSKS